MKKIIICALLSCGLLSTQSFAQDSNIYIGVDVLKSSNTFTYHLDNYSSSYNLESDSSAFKLKLGWVRDEGKRVQLYYLQEKYEDAPFDATNDIFSEIGIDFIKDFGLSPVLSPFMQVGIGYGWMKTDTSTYDDNTVSELNIKVGAGFIYTVVPEIEIIAGIDLQYKRWLDRTSGSYTIQTEEQSTKYYVGVNYRFN
ncbi:MAG: opacity protein-like surface antigen [Sulfurimonas sp.]|jgi:opacity protein-like surface antigen